MIAAILGVIVLVVAVRVLVPSRRTWVRVIGSIFIPLAIVATLVSAGLAVFGFAAWAYVNSFG